MDEKIFIMDTNFLININFFYNDKNENFEKILNLIKELIKKDKLIILDKVFYEFRNNFIKEKLNLLNKNSEKIINTDFLKNDFDNLAEKYYLKNNEKYLRDKDKENLPKDELIRKNKEDFKKINADLYLILYSKYLRKNNFSPIIITDENRNNDNKLYEKIPNICNEKNENIKILKTPQFIFKYFNLVEKK
jgi:hypothetical protein